MQNVSFKSVDDLSNYKLLRPATGSIEYVKHGFRRNYKYKVMFTMPCLFFYIFLLEFSRKHSIRDVPREPGPAQHI